MGIPENYKPSWSDQYNIGSYDVDFKMQLKLSSLTNYLQESAWKHANHLNFGLEFLHNNGLVWMLSSIRFEVDYLPKWPESFTIKTWPRGFDRLFYLRDFLMFDKEGNRFGGATTNWLLIDIKSRRPKMFEIPGNIIEKNKDHHALEGFSQKLPLIEKGEIFPQSVLYFDLDLNHHANSNRYVEWILNTFPYEFHKKHQVQSMQLNYIKEIPPNSQINLLRKNDENPLKFLIEGRSVEENKLHFQSRVTWKAHNNQV
ncbi:MAG: hypothetical protein JXJ22_01760 [Bacteroidales bacterium]|nr:hypothetical protein [Bacteroidales bacterium]